MQTRSFGVAAIIIGVYTCLVLADAWTTVAALRLESTVEVNPFIDIGSPWAILRFQLLPWVLFVVATLWAFPKTVASYGAGALTNDLTFSRAFAGIPLPVWAPAAVMLVIMIVVWSRLFTIANNTCIIFWYFSLLPINRFAQIIATETELSAEYSSALALFFLKLVIVIPPSLIASWFLLVQLVKFVARGMSEVPPSGFSVSAKRSPGSNP